MKILFIGDSIIRGSQGVDFISFLAFKHPEWEIENAGVNGETLTRIAVRLEERLATKKDYDVIVFEGGYNDILLPAFSTKGFFFKQALQHLLKKQYAPLRSPEAFAQKLRAVLQCIKAQSSAKVILTTLGCINENLDFSLNQQRWAYNEQIRQVAEDFDCALADVSPKFDKILSQQLNQDYFLESFLNTAVLDLLYCKYLHRADKLSRKRNLRLTIDGVHLNSHGAEIFMKEIEKQLLPTGK